MQNNLAPVVLFVYNRLDHTKQTIEALQRNELASQSDLVIFSDAAKNEKDIEKVELLRCYLDSVNGFKNVKLVKRETNYGLAKNIIEGVTDIINKYGKVIVLEDDLVTSRNFLCYINNALDYYANRDDIFAISGYSGVLKSLQSYDQDTYLAYRPSSWGWATWKNQWQDIDWAVADFDAFVKNKESISLFNRGGIDMTRMLKHYMQGKNNSWAIRWSYAMHKQEKYCVFPKISKIQNIGFGKDATHCSNTNIYQTALDSSAHCKFNFTDALHPIPKISKDFRYQFSYTNKLIKKTLGYLKGSS